MHYQNVVLEAFGYVLPEEVVGSVELERRLQPVYEQFGLHEGRLELMTGIAERRFWPAGSRPSDGSSVAGRRAVAAAGLTAADIDCLFHTSVSRDFLEPATASVVHHHLGLPSHAFFYDISNACLGFLNGMLSMANLIESGQIQRGLIVAGESSRLLVESTIESLLRNEDLSRRQLKQAFASLTIGSGAVALVMSHAEVARSAHRLRGGVVRAATEHNHLCQGSADVGFAQAKGAVTMATEAEVLLESGLSLARDTWADFQAAFAERGADSFARFFCHQVGTAHRDGLYQALGIPVGKDFSTFPFLGNVGSVSLPLTLVLGTEKQPPAPGEQLAMLGIGSGLSCAMLCVEW